MSYKTAATRTPAAIDHAVTETISKLNEILTGPVDMMLSLSEAVALGSRLMTARDILAGSMSVDSVRMELTRNNEPQTIRDTI